MADLSSRNRSTYRDRIREQREENLARLERESKRSNKAAKIFMLLLLVGWFVLTQVNSVKADGSIIEKISVKFTQNYGDGGEILEPTIETSTSNVVIDEIKYAKDPDKWKPGSRVLVTINLSAKEGYYFGSKWNREAVTLSDAEFSHCGRIDDGDILQLKVYYIPCAVLGDTESAGWDYNFKKAVWREVDYAPGYEVKLYKNDEEVATKKVKTTTIDFSDKIEDYTKDIFYYEVRAIPMTSDEKKYLKEGNWITSQEDVVNSHTGSPGVTPIGYNTTENTGTIPKYNGSKTSTTGWYNPGGTWFYYDTYGRVATGWQYLGGLWYYFNNQGQMMTGFLYDTDGSVYYLDPNMGYMKTGWEFINGSWYYFNSSGRMQTGYLYDNGKLYYLNEYGQMVAEQ
ncbi:putative cell wall binding protein [Lachnospiraceae bacterium JC7]|nr:putative cell wall binding protein [Lachnospiraceae bacterium JC7]